MGGSEIMKKRIRKINQGEHTSSARSAALVTTALPKVSPNRIRLVLLVLTLGGFAAIAADCWMSWEGFRTLPIDWWVSATLTSIVAVSQLGSGTIQALGGDPFKGIGGSTNGDGMWGMTLRGLYGLDIFSNFAGFGGTSHLSIGALLTDPMGAIGLVLWNGVLAILLAFGDEILFRLRDRIAIGAQKNQQLAKLREIQVTAHDQALNEFRTRAMAQARTAGQRANINFDWVEEDSTDV
jgi:hypothetical protein